MARHYTALILDDKSILNKPILVTVWSKDTAKLAAEPTQHNSLDRLHTRSKNQPLHCLWQWLHWTRSDWRVVYQQLPTVWPNKIGLFRGDMLARHLLQFAYEYSCSGHNLSDRNY